MSTPILAAVQDASIPALPESFVAAGSTLNAPLMALLVGIVIAAIAVLINLFLRSGPDRKKNAFAYGIIAFVLGTLVALPIIGAYGKDRFEVSGMVVNSILSEEGAHLGLDSTEREHISLHGGPIPRLGDVVDLDCLLTESDDARVFDCSLVSLEETEDWWMHP